MIKLKPLWDNVLIEPIVEEKKSSAGIILPEMEKEKSSRWTVVAVWEGKILDNWTRNNIDLEIWDVVYFTKYSPEEIEFEWKKYLLMWISGILAKESK